MWISKKLFKKEVERLEGKMKDIEVDFKQANCGHGQCYFKKLTYYNYDKHETFFAWSQTCPDCGFYHEIPEDRALPVMKKHHEDKIADIQKLIKDDK